MEILNNIKLIGMFGKPDQNSGLDEGLILRFILNPHSIFLNEWDVIQNVLVDNCVPMRVSISLQLSSIKKGKCT